MKVKVMLTEQNKETCRKHAADQPFSPLNSLVTCTLESAGETLGEQVDLNWEIRGGYTS